MTMTLLLLLKEWLGSSLHHRQLMQQDPILDAMRNGETHIDLSTLSVSHLILGQPLRNYFIKRVKEPFVKFIVWIGRKYPDPDKHSTSGQMDTTLRYVLDRLVKYNKEAKNRK